MNELLGNDLHTTLFPCHISKPFPPSNAHDIFSIRSCTDVVDDDNDDRESHVEVFTFYNVLNRTDDFDQLNFTWPVFYQQRVQRNLSSQ